MKQLTILLCAALCVTMSFTACGEDDEVVPNSAQSEQGQGGQDNGGGAEPIAPFEILMPEANWPLTDTQLAQASRMNDFAFRLFRQLQKPDTSLVLSPLSIDYALSMTALGAEGATRDSIVKALGFDVTEPQAMHNLMASLMQYLPSVDENVNINLANAFYLNASRTELSVNPDYQKTLKETYLADCEAVKTDTQEGINYINNWCSRQTNGFIPKVFDEPLSSENVCLLMNAIYFKGDWFFPFISENTHDVSFKREDNTSVMVPMMSMETEAKLSYAESELFQAVRLPYGKINQLVYGEGSPSSFGMTILLPCEGKTTTDILSWLTAAHFADLSKQMAKEEVLVSMPRFETTVSTRLLKAFEQLNLPFNEAELRGLVLSNGQPRGQRLSDAFQCARIKVNEKGTEAAAVTVMRFEYALHINTKYVVADHPFVYLLTDQQTGTILFVGTYHADEVQNP